MSQGDTQEATFMPLFKRGEIPLAKDIELGREGEMDGHPTVPIYPSW